MKRLIYLITIFAIIATYSCESFMEPKQDQSINTDYALKSREYFLGLLYAAYNGLPARANFDFDAATDDLITNKDGTPSSRFAKGGVSTQNNPLGDIWLNSYTQLNRINWFIEKMVLNKEKGKYPTPVRFDIDSVINIQKFNFYRAEAYFLRAWYYSELLRYYGGVGKDGVIYGIPLFTKYLTINDTIDKPRNLYSECVQQIVSDCDTAFKYLPLNYSKSSGIISVGLQADAGHASGAAALALKSRVLLYSASPAFNINNEQQRWVDAATVAGNAISIIGFENLLALSSYYSRSNLNDKNYSNRDLFFRGPIRTNDNTLESENFPPRAFGGKGNFNPTQNIVDAFPMNDGYPMGQSPTKVYDPNDITKNRDIRLDFFVVRNGEAYAGITINTSTGGEDAAGSDINATRSGYYLQKFLDASVSLENGKEIRTTRANILLGKPELYLNFAEAALMATGSPDVKIAGYSAREVLARVRLRSFSAGKDLYINTIADAPSFLNLIKNERRIELCFENHRFWDLRRWSTGVTDLNAVNMPAYGIYNVTEPVELRAFKSIFLPLPYSEILKTSRLVNNMGY